MIENPVWNSVEELDNFPDLHEDIHVDVAILGGGITGISAAYFLKKAGFKVAVLEAGKVAMGTTGHSTGNLYLTVDQSLSSLKSKYERGAGFGNVEMWK